MIIWPAQLRAINDLTAQKGLSTLELVDLSLSVLVVVSYTDGTYITKRLNHDGEEYEIAD